MTVGCVAGDEETYETFKEFFDPIIDQRHGGFKPTDKHKTDLDYSKVCNTRPLVSMDSTRVGYNFSQAFEGLVFLCRGSNTLSKSTMAKTSEIC